MAMAGWKLLLFTFAAKGRRLWSSVNLGHRPRFKSLAPLARPCKRAFSLKGGNSLAAGIALGLWSRADASNLPSRVWSLLFVFVAMGCGLLFGGCSLLSPPAKSQDPADAKAMVDAHNAARAKVSPPSGGALPALKWSDTLAQSAKAWAEKCIWKHSEATSVGENLFTGTGSYSAQNVVDSWVSEVANYDYATNTCKAGAQCGHYTQVVWRDTTEVGCAKVNCKAFLQGQDANFWVCQYSPPGNFRGQKPY